VHAIEVLVPQEAAGGEGGLTFVPVAFRQASSSSTQTYDRCAPPRLCAVHAGTRNREVHQQLSRLALGFLALRGDEHAGGAEGAVKAAEIVTNVETHAASRGDPLAEDSGTFSIGSSYHLAVNFLEADSVAAWQGRLPDQTSKKGVASGGEAACGTTLHQCLLKNAEREQLAEEDSVFCKKCKEHRRSWKKIELWSLPPHLIVHLKRFGRDRIDGPMTKITTPVEFPHELDLTSYLAQELEEPVYELVGVVNHLGGMGGGHYTAHAHVGAVDGVDDGDGEWYKFDDSRVSQSSLDDIDQAAGYILFYRRRRRSLHLLR